MKELKIYIKILAIPFTVGVLYLISPSIVISSILACVIIGFIYLDEKLTKLGLNKK